MLRSSFFFRLLVAVLCVGVALTGIAVVTKQLENDIGTPVETPTAEEVTNLMTSDITQESNAPIVVDNTKTIVATDSLNSRFDWITGPNNSTVMLAIVEDLKPGSNYRLSFWIDETSLSEETVLGANNEYYLMALCGNDSIATAMQGTKTNYNSGETLLNEANIEFTIDEAHYYTGDESGKAAMLFTFCATNTVDETGVEEWMNHNADCVVFTLYEITATS